MKNYLCRLIPLIFLALTACQGQEKVVVRETIREAPTGTGTSGGNTALGAPPGSSQVGGVDSVGGGNGVNQRPLESYSVNITTLPEFKEFIAPIIETLALKHQRFAADMAHIAINRTWFLIPVELNKLPANVIGVGFADQELQQLAIQNLSSVWINSNLFEKYPSAKDRALLILHEIVMGIRLMKLKSALDNCHSEIALVGLNPERRAEHNKLRDACALKYGLQSGGPGVINTSLGKIELSKEDYDNIRELVVHLSTQSENLSQSQLDAWLTDKSFRKY